MIDKQIKTPAVNERFHASGGVCPQTVLCGFGTSAPLSVKSLSPTRTFVGNPRLREVAITKIER